MAGSTKSRSRRNISTSNESVSQPSLKRDEPSNAIETYSTEVLTALLADGVPPTPNNFSLYFDRLLEEKSESFRKQIVSILELEEGVGNDTTVVLEQNLKKGFVSVKNILTLTANLYKNMALMSKILDKRKDELSDNENTEEAVNTIALLEGDISKLNTIIQKQSSQMKTFYDETADIVKTVENETIFDNQFRVYNKRYLMDKIKKEMELIREFKHTSSLIMIELSRELRDSVENKKAVNLMTRTIARLLLKTSRRSDIVAHYGHGVFAMLLKHTDIPSAQNAAQRLCDLVANSNFFLADKEIILKISIGISNIDSLYSVEEIVVNSMNGIEKSYENDELDYAVFLKTEEINTGN